MYSKTCLSSLYEAAEAAFLNRQIFLWSLKETDRRSILLSCCFQALFVCQATSESAYFSVCACVFVQRGISRKDWVWSFFSENLVSERNLITREINFRIFLHNRNQISTSTHLFKKETRNQV